MTVCSETSTLLNFFWLFICIYVTMSEKLGNIFIYMHLCIYTYYTCIWMCGYTHQHVYACILASLTHSVVSWS